jgi:regulator of sirC expression with transglutaminase-like and TPR domain
MRNKAQTHLAELARLPDAAIDLPRGALLISGLLQPELDPDLHLRRLESLAIAAVSSVTRDAPLTHRIAALNRFIYDQEGFTGNLADYYDPRNSFLDQVLERRTGIPITLALIYVELARQVGIPAFGVGFPGHFLVRVGQGGSTLVLDPFDHGTSLGEEDLDQRLADVYGEGAITVRANPAVLRAATRRETLVRMLANLKAIYSQAGDLEQALIAVNGILTLTPDSAADLRDRGMLYRELGYAPAAAADLRRYTEVSDDGEGIAAVQPIIAELEAGSVRLH